MAKKVVCIILNEKKEMLFTQIVTVENIPGYKCTLKGKRQKLK